MENDNCDKMHFSVSINSLFKKNMVAYNACIISHLVTSLSDHKTLVSFQSSRKEVAMPLLYSWLIIGCPLPN